LWSVEKIGHCGLFAFWALGTDFSRSVEIDRQTGEIYVDFVHFLIIFNVRSFQVIDWTRRAPVSGYLGILVPS
jgi:hypothetical protein